MLPARQQQDHNARRPWSWKPFDKDTLYFHSCAIPFTDTFFSKTLHAHLFISSECSGILALKALCKVRGGPSWCRTAPVESDPVLPAGLQWPGCPANLYLTTGLLPAGGNLLIHIRKHQPYRMYIGHDPIYFTPSESSKRQLASWDWNKHWDLPQGKSFDPPWDGIQPKDRRVDWWTIWGEQKPSETQNWP